MDIVDLTLIIFFAFFIFYGLILFMIKSEIEILRCLGYLVAIIMATVVTYLALFF